MLKDYEIIEGSCSACYFYGIFACTMGPDASTLCAALIGEGCILKKKEVWEACTKENTKVGDTVRGCKSDTTYLVRYIHHKLDEFLTDNNLITHSMCYYEIKEK